MQSFQNFSRSKIMIIALGDVALLLIGYVVSFWIRSLSRLIVFTDTIPFERFYLDYHHHLVLLAGLQLFLFYSFGLYDRLKQTRFSEMIRLASIAVTLQVLGLIAYYFFSNDFVFPRSIFPLFWSINIILASLWRIILTRMFKIKGTKRRVLIVGTSTEAHELVLEVERLATSGLEIVGFVSVLDNTENPAPEFVDGYPVLGTNENIPDIIIQHQINEVIITPSISWQDRFLADITKSEKTQTRVSIIPSLYEIMIAKMHHLKIYDIPLVEIFREPTSTLTQTIKSFIDIICSLIGLSLTMLAFPIIFVLIKMNSPGPVLFRQQRVGLEGKIFTLYKFRTMADHAEKATGPVLSSPDDKRITSVGHFLRRWRIDEMPQFWCVLKGDMSLVGPRPERPFFVEQYYREIPGYASRFKIKPGMTGLAQVNGSHQAEAKTKLKYDLAYIYNQSLWLDILIILETVKVIITGRVS